MTLANGSTASATDVIAADAAIAAVPANLIAHTTDAGAPTGWAEYTAGRGFLICGLQSGGTAAGTVGTAFTNQQNKARIAHTHTGPSHAHANGGTGVAGSGGGNFNAWNADLNSGNSGAGGTGATGSDGAVNTSDVLAYIQLLGIKKS